MTVLAAWLGLHMRSVWKQRAAIEAVQRHGGWVTFDYEATGLPVPAWLSKSLGHDHFHSVASLEMITRIPPEANYEEVIRHLSGFPKLKRLSLSEPQLSDSELNYVGQLTTLRELRLVQPYIFTGQDGKYGSSSVTDDGLTHLKRLTQLRTLTLANLDVTEDGLRHLTDLKKLEHLELRRSKVKDASWLQERLPDCKIILQ